MEAGTPTLCIVLPQPLPRGRVPPRGAALAAKGMLDISISLPPGMTGDAARAAADIGVHATDNLVKLARELRGPTYFLLSIVAGWVGFKAFVAVHQELCGAAQVKHEVVHHRNDEPSSA